MAPAFSHVYYEDPTVAQTAALEYARLWDRISARVALGVWFYRAREEVLAEEIPDIATAYGKPVADRVQRAIQQTNPDQHLSQAARDKGKEIVRRSCEEYLLERGGISPLNALWLRWFGRHLY